MMPSVDVDDDFVSSNAQRWQLNQGADLHRFHRDKFAGNQCNATSSGDARFSPLKRSDGTIIPTIYAGLSFDGAAAESIFHSVPMPGPARDRIVNLAQFADFCVSRLVTRTELEFVMLDTMGHSQLGLGRYELVESGRAGYPRARDWALKLHRCCPWAQGLAWQSRQASAERVLVIFGDRVDDALGLVDTNPILSPPTQDRLLDLGARWAIDIL